MPDATARALVHVLRGDDVTRYWAQAVRTLSTMDGLGRSQVWLALLHETCADQINWAQMLVSVSQSKCLMEQALAEVMERSKVLEFPEAQEEIEDPVDYTFFDMMQTPPTPSTPHAVEDEDYPASSASSSVSMPGIRPAVRRQMQEAINTYAPMHVPQDGMVQAEVAGSGATVAENERFRVLAAFITEAFDFKPLVNERPKDTVDAFIKENKRDDETYEACLQNIEALYVDKTRADLLAAKARSDALAAQTDKTRADLYAAQARSDAEAAQHATEPALLVHPRPKTAPAARVSRLNPYGNSGIDHRR